MTQRIIQLLMKTGTWTRSQVRKMLLTGAVTVDGKTISSEHYFVKEEAEVFVYGEKLKLPTGKIYLMLNKPPGYSCQKGTHPNVLNLVPGRTVFSVGRLDKYTTGLLLLTNDGYYAHRILSPDHKTEKEYYVTTEKELTEEQLSSLCEGVSIKLGTTLYTTKPASVKKLTSHSLHIIIKEGKKRQIRKMLKTIRNKVVDLKRIRIGKLELKNLELGTYKELTEEEALTALA